MSITIKVKERSSWDPYKEEFVPMRGGVLVLEHSLVSISKWESIWKKAFLSNPKKGGTELLSYIKCMTITQNVPEEVFLNLSTNKQLMQQILDYTNDSKSATKFAKKDEINNTNIESITSELIYYWMIEYGIPFSCEKWHLNRLLTLIDVCVRKNTSNPSKKSPMSAGAIAKRNALNAERRARLKTKG